MITTKVAGQVIFDANLPTCHLPHHLHQARSAIKPRYGFWRVDGSHDACIHAYPDSQPPCRHMAHLACHPFAWRKRLIETIMQSGKRSIFTHRKLLVNRPSQDLLPPTDIQPAPMHVYDAHFARVQSGAYFSQSHRNNASRQNTIISTPQSSCDELLQGIVNMKLDDFSVHEDAETCDGCGRIWPADELRTHIPNCSRRVSNLGLLLCYAALNSN
ncbi:uncharacterized protein EDB91DRAFT_699700 [Suillus paluster]|uniref:uncharacterized protein n=1 Tax=Suillus paluster TaxID=48578 RepID=UPI001B8645CB|nr:uncharacterized protein EDB91DRAFT_699700 [Suillus paluster]KAG1750632.1 hypothetical protein EDB91DRAFT_699700 [Suillus paluster]